jgi:hypothetical protein
MHTMLQETPEGLREIDTIHAQIQRASAKQN